MTTATNREIVRRYYDRVYNSRELDALEDVLAPAFVSSGPGGAGMDRAAHIAALRSSLAALPDLRLTIEEQIAEGDAVVTRWSATAHHEGTLFGIPPTGRAVSASAVHIHHLKDGRLIDQWEQFDTLGMLRQLGVLPGS